MACFLMAWCLCIGALASEPSCSSDSLGTSTDSTGLLQSKVQIQIHTGDQGSETAKDTKLTTIPMIGIITGAHYTTLDQDGSEVDFDTANGQVSKFKNAKGYKDVNNPIVFVGDTEDATATVDMVKEGNDISATIVNISTRIITQVGPDANDTLVVTETSTSNYPEDAPPQEQVSAKEEAQAAAAAQATATGAQMAKRRQGDSEVAAKRQKTYHEEAAEMADHSAAKKKAEEEEAKAPLEPKVSFAAAREQKYLELHGPQKMHKKVIGESKSLENLERFSREAFPDEEVDSSPPPEDLVHMLAGTRTRDGGAISNGNTLPQIKMPWGFNDWVPQTDGNNGAWWFHQGDTQFQGMRCTHQPSPWIGDYGHFLLQPHIGDEPKDLRYSSENSVFRPYLFSATLEGIGFEFVPTSHAAIVRLTFPDSAQTGHVSLSVGKGSVSVEDGHTIRGYTTDNSGGVPDNFRMFFTMVAATGAHAETGADDNELVKLSADDGVDMKRGTLHFRTDDGPVLITMATSFISQEQADLNLEQEVGSKSFQQVLSDGQAKWAEQLGRVRIEAIDKTQETVFYTNLWKSMLFPRYLQEVDSQGQEWHQSPYTGKPESGKMVADSGFWDSYRTVYQLQSLVFPDNLGSLIDGWVKGYKEAGWLPEWASPGQHDSMVGTMGDVTLADAIAKSNWGFLKGFDVEMAYEAIKKDAFHDPQRLFGRKGLHDYIEKGYVTADVSESVSRTMNYYEADAAIARAAQLLNRSEDAKELAARSKRYSILFNNVTSFFQPKGADGKFTDGFDPLSWGSGFTEAGAWQYRFSVPHDVDGLKELYDGKLCDAIESMMNHTSGQAFKEGSYGTIIHEMRELSAIQHEFGLYAHGNQPVHHILYVAKKAGCNDIADKYLRKVTQDLYTIDGWAGDEDNGEMASWYVLSALGVYQLEGAKDEVVLGSPAVKHATLQLPNEKTLTIATENQATKHVYVQSVTWVPEGGDTQTITDNVLKFTDLMHGGKLTFTMGPSPKSYHPGLVQTGNLRATKAHQSFEAAFLKT